MILNYSVLFIPQATAIQNELQTKVDELVNRFGKGELSEGYHEL
jgi:hypothetical protein